MIKVWFLILKSGIVAGTIGPSPLDIDQCNQFAQQRMVERDQVISSGVSLIGNKLSKKEIADLEAISFQCVDRAERPQWGERP